MNPLYLRLLMLVPMFALLMAAAVIDVRRRRIPNWLTMSLAATGLLQSVLPMHAASPLAISPLQAMAGLLAGLALNFGLFVLHIRGGGDVKLFAAVGAWVGPLAILEIFILATIVAAMLAVVQCIVAGKLAALMHSTGLLAVSIAHPRELGATSLTHEPDGTVRSVGRPVPYAVPVIVATMLVLTLL